MTPPDTKNSSTEVITRKKFIGSAGGLATGAVIGAAAYLSSEQKADATGTLPAYLNVVETFAADQTFSGNVIFKNGCPWFDVRAFGALGNGTTNDSTAINNAILSAISISSGTNTTGNPIIYFPPGDYLLNHTGSSGIVAYNNSSGFTLLGAGYQTSRLIWGSIPAAATPMMAFNNGSRITIKDIGFIGNTANPPSCGIMLYSSNSTGFLVGSPPTELLLERVFLGGTSSGTWMTAAILFYEDTAHPCSYANNTFRDVTIQNVGTGYQFAGFGGAGAPDVTGTLIEGGAIQNCSVAAIDNTPSPSWGSTGGNYTVMGTRFSGNAVTFRIGQTQGTGGGPINIMGIHAGAPTPETKLVDTPYALTDQSVTFTGGHAIMTDPGSGNSINFNATQGQLEFHGFRIYSPTGVAWNFPGTGQVNFYGGKLTSKTCNYNGPLQLHGTRETLTPVFTPTSGSTTARLAGFGYQGHLAGSTAMLPTANISIKAASGSGATATVKGGDVGGTITLHTGTSGLATGALLQVTMVASFLSPPNLLLSPGNAAAAAVMLSVYSSGNTTTAFFLDTGTALTASTSYIWNYVLMG